MILTITILLQLSQIYAMNLPGLSPEDYKMNHKFDILMSYIESEGIGTSFDYYEVGFCPMARPASELYKVKNFGEALNIEHWIVSPYSDDHALVLGKNETCRQLCTTTYSKATQARLGVLASRGFEYKLMIDDLPSATVIPAENTTTQHNNPNIVYNKGIRVAKWNPLKSKVEGGLGVSSVNNHLIMTIDYHKDSTKAVRIVGFDVEAKSVDWPIGKSCEGDIDSLPLAYYDTDKQIEFTY